MRTRFPVVVLALVSISGPVGAGEQTCNGPLVRSEADFVFRAAGAQVQDKKSGLIWARCIEGQSWTGDTCVADDPNAVNPGPRVTFAQAQKLATSKSAAEEGWRLPTKAELVSLREPNCHNPSMSLKVFPTKPAWSSGGSFWTSTREGQGVSVVSAIGNSDAWSATDDSKTNHVRLVRTPPKEPK